MSRELEALATYLALTIPLPPPLTRWERFKMRLRGTWLDVGCWTSHT